MCTLEHAYKATSTAYPTNEDVSGLPSRCPQKRKPLLSQERAKTKKASLDGSDTGSSPSIGGGPSPNRKVSSSPSSG